MAKAVEASGEPLQLVGEALAGGAGCLFGGFIPLRTYCFCDGNRPMGGLFYLA